MTDRPPSSQQQGMPRSPDQRLRELGLTFIMRLAALIRVGKSYQVGNQVFATQMRSLHQVLESILAETDEAVIVALETDLYLNGFRIPIRTSNVRFHRSILEEFKRRAIAGIKAERGVELGELDRFFELFMQPEIYFGANLLEACLIAGIDRIQPAVHASTSSYDGPAVNPESPWEEPGSGEGGGSGGGSGGGRGTGEGHGTGGSGADPGQFGDLPEEAGRPGMAPRGSARKSYWMAMAGTKSLLAPTSLHRELEMRSAKRVVQPLVDGALDKEPVIVGLATLGHHDEFTYAHSVNVTMVAVTMGHVLGLDRRALADLGVAALLHDVGKNAVADVIKHPVENFTEEERAAAERHPLEGVKLLARSTALNETTIRCMRASLEHHMAAGGKGYPRIEGWKPSALSQIISVADCYVCLQTYRSRHGANVTPYQALGMVLGPLRGSFEPIVLWALVQAVGLYPPGQLIELDDGTIGLVLAPNPNDLEKPHVKIIARADRRRMTPEERVEHRPLPSGLNVRRALKAEEYPEDPTDEEKVADGEAMAS
jgi:HD-GYP domain-containing protein (c-di-GMP phosphodiesterase class II)